eukprot:375428-Pyramimonas_sp.AAC.1
MKAKAHPPSATRATARREPRLRCWDVFVRGTGRVVSMLRTQGCVDVPGRGSRLTPHCPMSKCTAVVVLPSLAADRPATDQN